MNRFGGEIRITVLHMLSLRWRRGILWKQTIGGIELQFFTEPKRTVEKADMVCTI